MSSILMHTESASTRCTMDTSVPERTPPPFMLLPPEIRIRIYKEIILSSRDRVLQPAKLRNYCGLVLSCTQAKNEFQYEWAKAFNASIKRTLKECETTLGCQFRAVPVREFRDAKKSLRVIVSGPRPKIITNLVEIDQEEYHAARSALRPLFREFPHITFELAAHSFTPLDGTIEGFFNSDQFCWLTSLRLAVDRRAVTARMNYKNMRLHCVPLVSGPDSTALESLSGAYLEDVLHLVLERGFQSCKTMDDLEQYRGLFMASSSSQEDFEYYVIEHLL